MAELLELADRTVLDAQGAEDLEAREIGQRIEDLRCPIYDIVVSYRRLEIALLCFAHQQSLFLHISNQYTLCGVFRSDMPSHVCHSKRWGR